MSHFILNTGGGTIKSFLIDRIRSPHCGQTIATRITLSLPGPQKSVRTANLYFFFFAAECTKDIECVSNYIHIFK